MTPLATPNATPKIGGGGGTYMKNSFRLTKMPTNIGFGGPVKANGTFHIPSGMPMND